MRLRLPGCSNAPFSAPLSKFNPSCLLPSHVLFNGKEIARIASTCRQQQDCGANVHVLRPALNRFCYERVLDFEPFSGVPPFDISHFQKKEPDFSTVSRDDDRRRFVFLAHAPEGRYYGTTSDTSFERLRFSGFHGDSDGPQSWHQICFKLSYLNAYPSSTPFSRPSASCRFERRSVPATALALGAPGSVSTVYICPISLRSGWVTASLSTLVCYPHPVFLFVPPQTQEVRDILKDILKRTLNALPAWMATSRRLQPERLGEGRRGGREL